MVPWVESIPLSPLTDTDAVTQAKCLILLDRLSEAHVTVDILKETKVGKQVHRLKSATNTEVYALRVLICELIYIYVYLSLCMYVYKQTRIRI